MITAQQMRELAIAKLPNEYKEELIGLINEAAEASKGSVSITLDEKNAAQWSVISAWLMDMGFKISAGKNMNVIIVGWMNSND